MSKLGVTWEEPAERLLLQRDRFTRQAITEEFARDPRERAIVFDPEHKGYLTPVADNRYSVVWYLDEDQQAAVVRAVVPSTNVVEQDGLKDYVQRVVQIESKGLIGVS